MTPWYENYGAGSIFYTNKVGIGTTAVPDTNQLLVKGGTETDRLNVTGVSTFTGAIDANGDIDVDGHTNLDNVSIAGVTTTSDGIYLRADVTGGSSTKRLHIGASDDLTIFHDTTNSYIQNHTGDLIIGDTNHIYVRGYTSDKSAGLWFNNGEKIRTTNTGVNVTGTTDTDNFINAGVSTFVGIITASAVSNVIPFLYSIYSDLPAASSYHGAFAHVHSVGKAFFAHAGAWMEIVSKETNGTVGTGTERYNVGAIDGTSINITGISTFKGDVNLGDADTDNIVFGGDVNSHIIPNTNVTYDLGSTT